MSLIGLTSSSVCSHCVVSRMTTRYENHGRIGSRNLQVAAACIIFLSVFPKEVHSIEKQDSRYEFSTSSVQNGKCG